jgi:hypothetical protein
MLSSVLLPEPLGPGENAVLFCGQGKRGGNQHRPVRVAMGDGLYGEHRERWPAGARTTLDATVGGAPTRPLGLSPRTSSA